MILHRILSVFVTRLFTGCLRPCVDAWRHGLHSALCSSTDITMIYLCAAAAAAACFTGLAVTNCTIYGHVMSLYSKALHFLTAKHIGRSKFSPVKLSDWSCVLLICLQKRETYRHDGTMKAAECELIDYLHHLYTHIHL